MRVVSLCPSITETLVAIGGLPSLAGVTKYCTRPKGLLWGVPRIGGTKTPDVSRILDLKPDVVFANAEENRREDVEALRAAGVEVDVTLPRRVAEVPPAIRKWGERLGSLEEADALATRIEARLEQIAAEPAPAPFRYAYWIWKDPWMTVSDDTYVADLVRFAGGVNVFGPEPSRYPAAAPSDAVARGTDVHIFPSEPYPFSEERHGAQIARAFGPSARRVFVDGDDYCWHGARTLDGLRAVRSLMSGGSDPDQPAP
jgi:iron complex transport system substrate-binding protein